MQQYLPGSWTFELPGKKELALQLCVFICFDCLRVEAHYHCRISVMSHPSDTILLLRLLHFRWLLCLALMFTCFWFAEQMMIVDCGCTTLNLIWFASARCPQRTDKFYCIKGNIAENTCHAFWRFRSWRPKVSQIAEALAAYSRDTNKIRSSPPRSSIKARIMLLSTSWRQSSPPYFSNSSYATLGDTPDGLDLVWSRRTTWLLKRSFSSSSSFCITVDQSHRTSSL